MIEYDISQLGTQLGSSAGIGFIIGYAIKQVARVIVALLGMQAGILVYLESNGVITVHWERFQAISMIEGTDPSNVIFSSFRDMFAAIPVVSGVATGAVIGFKLG
jgi:uncharacterized membrane protein (Fun14 family)